MAGQDKDNDNSLSGRVDQAYYGSGKMPAPVSLIEAKETCRHLGQENDTGNVEFKWKLVGKTGERLRHLITQMNYRLTEGNGEAVYEIGVEDNGYPLGISDADLAESIETLEKMARELDADVVILHVAKGVKGKVAEILVRRVSDVQFEDIRICAIGSADSGKSTLIGTLTSGVLDNGKGLTRMNVFRHRHEVEQGRTSSMSRQILGFDQNGQATNPNANSLLGRGWKDIIESSSKILTFLDLAGHQEHLKTTVVGLTGQVPDYSLVAIDACSGLQGMMTREHINVSLALNIPIFIVITKIDICTPEALKRTMQDLLVIMKTGQKKPVLFQNHGDEGSSNNNHDYHNLDELAQLVREYSRRSQNDNKVKSIPKKGEAKGLKKYETDRRVTAFSSQSEEDCEDEEDLLVLNTCLEDVAADEQAGVDFLNLMIDGDSLSENSNSGIENEEDVTEEAVEARATISRFDNANNANGHTVDIIASDLASNPAAEEEEAAAVAATIPNRNVTNDHTDNRNNADNNQDNKRVNDPAQLNGDSQLEKAKITAAALKLAKDNDICPIFVCSSVTGQGLKQLKQFLNLLPKSKDWSQAKTEPLEVSIDEVFTVDGVGTVVSGVIMKGVVTVGSRVLLGPSPLGDFRLVTIKSIHVSRTPKSRAVAGQSATLALKRTSRSKVRQGMVILDPTSRPQASVGFDARISVVARHPSKIRSKYQPVVHIGNIRQTACVTVNSNNTDMTDTRTNTDTCTNASTNSHTNTNHKSKQSNHHDIDTATTAASLIDVQDTEKNSNYQKNENKKDCEITKGKNDSEKTLFENDQVDDPGALIRLDSEDGQLVRFQWRFRPEYIKHGDQFVFREGRTQGIGTVVNLYFVDEEWKKCMVEMQQANGGTVAHLHKVRRQSDLDESMGRRPRSLSRSPPVTFSQMTERREQVELRTTLQLPDSACKSVSNTRQVRINSTNGQRGNAHSASSASSSSSSSSSLLLIEQGRACYQSCTQNHELSLMFPQNTQQLITGNQDSTTVTTATTTAKTTTDNVEISQADEFTINSGATVHKNDNNNNNDDDVGETKLEPVTTFTDAQSLLECLDETSDEDEDEYDSDYDGDDDSGSAGSNQDGGSLFGYENSRHSAHIRQQRSRKQELRKQAMQTGMYGYNRKSKSKNNKNNVY